MYTIRERLGPLCPNIRTLILHIPVTDKASELDLLAAPLSMVLDSPSAFTYLNNIVLKIECECFHVWTNEGLRCNFDLKTTRWKSGWMLPEYQPIYDVLKKLLAVRSDLQLYVHFKTMCEPDLVREIHLEPWFKSIADTQRIHVGK